MSKKKIALWVLRNRRARGLLVLGLKNRRLRGIALSVARRRLGR